MKAFACIRALFTELLTLTDLTAVCLIVSTFSAGQNFEQREIHPQIFFFLI